MAAPNRFPPAGLRLNWFGNFIPRQRLPAVLLAGRVLGVPVFLRARLWCSVEAERKSCQVKTDRELILKITRQTDGECILNSRHIDADAAVAFQSALERTVK